MSSAYGPNSRKSLMMMLTNSPGPNIYRRNTSKTSHELNDKFIHVGVFVDGKSIKKK